MMDIEMFMRTYLILNTIVVSVCNIILFPRLFSRIRNGSAFTFVVTVWYIASILCSVGAVYDLKLFPPLVALGFIISCLVGMVRAVMQWQRRHHSNEKADDGEEE